MQPYMRHDSAIYSNYKSGVTKELHGGIIKRTDFCERRLIVSCFQLGAAGYCKLVRRRSAGLWARGRGALRSHNKQTEVYLLPFPAVLQADEKIMNMHQQGGYGTPCVHRCSPSPAPTLVGPLCERITYVCTVPRYTGAHLEPSLSTQ